MSSESLHEYESILAKRVTQLMDRLEGLSGAVDIAAWFSFFTYASFVEIARHSTTNLSLGLTSWETWRE